MKILIVGEVSHNIAPYIWEKQKKNELKQFGEIKNHFIVGSIPWGIEDTAKEIGLELECFNYSGDDYVFQKPSNSGGIFKFLIRKMRRKLHNIKGIDTISLNGDLIKKIKKNKLDFIYVIAGHYIMPGTLKKINEMGISIYLYTGVFPELLKDYVLEGLKYYNGIFSCEKVGIERYKKEYGIKNIYYVNLGCSPNLHKKVKLNKDESKYYDSDISFVGQFSEERLSLFEEISKITKVKIFGTKWPKINEDNLKTLPPVWGTELVKVYNGAKIVVNIHQPWVKWGINYRTYEVAGCRTFQLIDDKPGLYKQFKVGEEIITYKDHNELLEKIKYYIKNSKERNEIAERSQKKVYSEYTWKNHLETIIEVYKNENN